tara:strand:- start:763 stop:1092 length:330 start_codon:yes stop_codon:yes gene_type:complete
MAYAPGPGENRALSLIKWPFGKEYFGGLSSFGLICLGVYQPGPGSLAVPASSALSIGSPNFSRERRENCGVETILESGTLPRIVVLIEYAPAPGVGSASESRGRIADPN